MAETSKSTGKKKAVASTKKAGPDAEKVAATRALSPFEEMDRFFDNFIHRGFMRPFRWELPAWGEAGAPFEGRMPKVDVIDRDNEVVVKAEIPGVNKEDLEVSTTDNTVTIKGTTSHEEKEEKGDFYRCEISRGSFSRTVALPSDVDNSKAKASFKNGILELTLPKVSKSKRRSIKVD